MSRPGRRREDEMDIGTGIAIFGVWIVPAAAFLSETATGVGIVLAMFLAVMMTVDLVIFGGE